MLQADLEQEDALLPHAFEVKSKRNASSVTCFLQGMTAERFGRDRLSFAGDDDQFPVTITLRAWVPGNADGCAVGSESG